MRTKAGGSRGFAILRWLAALLGAIVTLIVLTVAFYEGRKAYWDHKIARLCESEGGVVINERIMISPSQQASLPIVAGYVAIPSRSLAAPDSPAFGVVRETVIREMHPRVVRRDETVFRRADGKAVGRITRYARIDGDFPTGIAHPSHFSCPDAKALYAAQSGFFQVEDGSQ